MRYALSYVFGSLFQSIRDRFRKKEEHEMTTTEKLKLAYAELAVNYAELLDVSMDVAQHDIPWLVDWAIRREASIFIDPTDKARLAKALFIASCDHWDQRELFRGFNRARSFV